MCFNSVSLLFGDSPYKKSILINQLPVTGWKLTLGEGTHEKEKEIKEKFMENWAARTDLIALTISREFHSNVK